MEIPATMLLCLRYNSGEIYPEMTLNNIPE
jgi:hypothetical protein